MTKTKIMSVFAIVAVAAMMGTAVIAPAFAGAPSPASGAQKVAWDDRPGGEDITGFCIANIDANGDLHVIMHVKGFDRGDDVKFGLRTPVVGIQTSAIASGGGIATSGEIIIEGNYQVPLEVDCRVGTPGNQEAKAVINLI